MNHFKTLKSVMLIDATNGPIRYGDVLEARDLAIKSLQFKLGSDGKITCGDHVGVLYVARYNSLIWERLATAGERERLQEIANTVTRRLQEQSQRQPQAALLANTILNLRPRPRNPFD